MRGNIRTGLKARRQIGDSMAEFDRLPPGARIWVRGAVLPWSARSVRRRWCEAMARCGGDEAAARAALDALERRVLARDRIAAEARR